MKAWLIGGLALVRSLLAIQHVDCTTQFGPCPDDLRSRAQFLVGTAMYLPLPSSQIAQAYSGLPQVAQVTASRHFPNRIEVKLVLRRPIAVVEGSAKEWLVVDDQGLVFESRSQSALPLISFTTPVEVGTHLAAEQLSAAKMVVAVAEIVGQTVAGKVDGNTLTAITSNGVEIVLDVNKAQNDWGASLQSIWARSKIDGKLMHKIDLRFNGATVSF